MSKEVGQVKRDPTLGCSIEISLDLCRYVCLRETHTKNLYAKMRVRNYMVQTRACSKSVWEFETEYHLESLILPSSGRFKPTCDIRIINFYI